MIHQSISQIMANRREICRESNEDEKTTETGCFQPFHCILNGSWDYFCIQSGKWRKKLNN